MKHSRYRPAQQGFSILEVMVAVALMGLATYFLVSMLKNGSMSQKTLQAQDDARVLTDDMAALLSNPVACANTFAGVAGSPNPAAADPVDGNGSTVSNIVDGSLKAQFTVGNIYGNRGLKLMGITVGGTGTDAKTRIQKWVPGAVANTGTAFVQVNWLQTGSSGNQGTGPQNLYRYFMVYADDINPSNRITGCTAQAGGASGYWTLNSANNIYNNNNGGEGYVGIGTTSPRTALDVNGGIRPGSATAGAACGPLGTMAYNGSTGTPLYCNSSGVWAASGGLSPCTIVKGSQGAGSSATCSAGYTLMGGGCQTIRMSGTSVYDANNYPSSSTTWTCNYGTNIVAAYAVCCH